MSAEGSSAMGPAALLLGLLLGLMTRGSVCRDCMGCGDSDGKGVLSGEVDDASGDAGEAVGGGAGMLTSACPGDG